jgi:hypothetical protein
VFSPLKSAQKRPADLARFVAELRAGEGEYSLNKSTRLPCGQSVIGWSVVELQFVLSRRRPHEVKVDC